jgi:hypothetical protein
MLWIRVFIYASELWPYLSGQPAFLEKAIQFSNPWRSSQFLQKRQEDTCVCFPE